MAPKIYSRYMFCSSYIDSNGDRILTEPVPYRYKNFSDNRIHTVKEGDSLFSLASRYFSGFDRAAGLWWIIADFQPEPIHDPTLKLKNGRVLIIPSIKTVMSEIFNNRRYDE